MIITTGLRLLSSGDTLNSGIWETDFTKNAPFIISIYEDHRRSGTVGVVDSPADDGCYPLL